MPPCWFLLGWPAVVVSLSYRRKGGPSSGDSHSFQYPFSWQSCWPAPLNRRRPQTHSHPLQSSALLRPPLNHRQLTPRSPLTPPSQAPHQSPPQQPLPHLLRLGLQRQSLHLLRLGLRRPNPQLLRSLQPPQHLRRQFLLQRWLLSQPIPLSRPTRRFRLRRLTQRSHRSLLQLPNLS